MRAAPRLTTTRRTPGTALEQALAAALVAVAVPACAGAPHPAPAQTPATPAASRPATPPPPEPAEPRLRGAGQPCGALDCRRFDDAATALRYVLRSNPLALGIGEAHAPTGTEGFQTTAARFTEQLLPLLEGRASHLIVELLRPNPACAAAAHPLERAQKPVIEGQSRNNQRDYLQLGVRAKALGIEPFLLTPSCEEFQAIADAGDDAILVTLATIARITTRLVKGALLQDRKAGRERIVVAYGGALHNDLEASAPASLELGNAPAEQAARAQAEPAEQLTESAFRYGNQLSTFTGGRYIALDLIVRELIKDNPVWRALPWYGAFDPRLHPDSYVVLQTSPQSYVLFFPGFPSSAAAAALTPAN